jgi:hypothetical protein
MGGGVSSVLTENLSNYLVQCEYERKYIEQNMLNVNLYLNLVQMLEDLQVGQICAFGNTKKCKQNNIK